MKNFDNVRDSDVFSRLLGLTPECLSATQMVQMLLLGALPAELDHVLGCHRCEILAAQLSRQGNMLPGPDFYGHPPDATGPTSGTIGRKLHIQDGNRIAVIRNAPNPPWLGTVPGGPARAHCVQVLA
jgi:hypothetical protein